MWFTEGGFNNDPNIRYAESVGGDNWTISDTVLLSNYSRPNIYQENGNYWLYVTTGDKSKIELYRSSSEIISSTDKVSDVLSVSGSGWDSNAIGNHTTWKEDGTYYMIYEANASDTVWEMGEATSSDGESWTKSADNPTLDSSEFGYSGAVGGPDMHIVDGTYYLWFHIAKTDFLPTDGAVTKTTDLRTWEENPDRQVPTFIRTEDWEGVDNSEGQVADLSVLSHPDLSKTHMWYAGATGQSNDAFSIGHATTDKSLTEIYNHNP